MSSISPNQSPVENHPTMFSEQEEIIPWVGSLSVPCSEPLQNNNNMQFDMSRSSFLEENINLAKQDIPRTTDLNEQECNVAFAWWHSWIWSSQQVRTRRKDHRLLALMLQMSINYKDHARIRQFIIANSKKYFSHIDSKVNLNINFLTISCEPSPLKEWHDILQCQAIALKKDMPVLIHEVCAGLITRKGYSYYAGLTKSVCAWGLHQMYCLYSREVQSFFASKNIQFLQSWDMDLIAQQSPQPDLPQFFHAKLDALSHQSIDKCREPSEMIVHAIHLPRTTDLSSREVDIAFAWWYSWVRKESEQMHPFQTDDLRLANFKEIKQFLACSTKKYFVNAFLQQTNLLKISCMPSPLAELQDILYSKAMALQQTMQSFIGEVCVYIMVKAVSSSRVYLSRSVCAWGLHQVYLLYSQEVRDLFASKGIEFLPSWDIHLVEQQLLPPNLLRCFRQKLQLLSKKASSSLGQQPPLYPIQVDCGVNFQHRLENFPKNLPIGFGQFPQKKVSHSGWKILCPKPTAMSIVYTPQVDLPRPANATKKRPLADMEDSIAVIQTQEKEEIPMQNFHLQLEPLISESITESDLKDPFGKDFEGWQNLDLYNEDSDFEDILNLLDES